MALTDVSLQPSDVLDEIASLAHPLPDERELDPLLDRIGDARYVLLGEASHGPSEYYEWRATITRRLIAEKGFSFVAVEGDCPDCFRVNEWVKGRADDGLTARDVVDGFERWPTWMWANREVASFVGWLRDHNQRTGQAVGFYGLDVYSLWESLRRVFTYLGTNQPAAVDANPEAELDALQNAEVLAGAERYDPRRDPRGNWVPTVMGRRYDAFCYFETTEALHPLHLERPQASGERDTWPWSA